MKQMDRKKIVEQLRAAGLPEPVHVIPYIPTMDEIRRDYVSPYVIVPDPRANPAQSMYLYKNRKDKVLCAVQRKAGEKITGTCRGFAKNRTGSCAHLGDLCVQLGLDIPGGGFQFARRLFPSFRVYPEGSESARLNKAYAVQSERAREFAYNLCRNIPGVLPPWPALTKKDTRTRRKPKKGGRNGIPFRVLLYAGIYKVLNNLTLVKTKSHLKDDPFFKKLGWQRVGGKGKRGQLLDMTGPCKDRLSEAFAHPMFRQCIEDFIQRVSLPARDLDYAIAIDSTGIGQTHLANWLAQKPKNTSKDDDRDADIVADESNDASAASEKRYIKPHISMGVVSGTIYAVDVTLDAGEATHDVKHFVSVAERTSYASRYKIILADKAYHAASNYAACQDNDKILCVLLRKGILIENAREGRELMTVMDWLRRKHYHVFQRFYRLRPLVEGVFSSQKRTGGHIRLRMRKWELERIAAMAYPAKVRRDEVGPAIYRLREQYCFSIASELVGVAQCTEALLRSLVYNLNNLVILEHLHEQQVDQNFTTRFRPIRRVSLPRIA